MNLKNARCTIATMFTTGLLLAACGGDDGGSGGAATQPAAPNPPSSGQPQAPAPAGEAPAAPKAPAGSPEIKELMIKACKEQAAREDPALRERLESKCEEIG